MLDKVQAKSRVVTAADVTAAVINFDFHYTLPVHAVVTVQDTNGVVRAWDGAYTVSANRVTVDNTGATDWAATDVVIVAPVAVDPNG